MKYSLAFLAAVVAVNASPVAMPQGVTDALTPTAAAPSGCMPSMAGSFGIAVLNITGGAMGATQAPDGQPQASGVTQISDGQLQGPTGTPAPPVTQISDGQIQGPTDTPAPPVSQISDGQIQGPTGAPVPPVSQISDGQIQNPTMTVAPVSQISDGQIQATNKMTMAPVSQISDGQIQATYAPVSQISDGQIQATKTAPAVSQISDGQIQASTAPAVSEKPDGQPNATGVSQIPDGQPQATGSPDGGSGMMMVGCKSDSSLTLTLEGGILKDAQGRTGYIASNYQFQFDAPPQAGSIYTAGWSVCGNGSLALGGSNVFYQCLSGGFYNLYNENWAPQCNAVTINVLELVDC